MALWRCPLSISGDKRLPMTTGMKIRLSYAWVILIIVSSCCDTSISKYEPKNQEEREIIALLIEYKMAKYHFEIEKLLPLLHDRGEFTFQCGRMLTKAGLKKELPGFWAKLRSGDTAIIPLVHECINGDYYESGEFNNPEIEINDDTALANVLFTNGVCRVPLYVTILRENDRWLITRTEWGES
jgi:hypothetical protein